MHKCEPVLEELFSIRNKLADDHSNILGIDIEISKKLYAINIQINRHIKQKGSEIVE